MSAAGSAGRRLAPLHKTSSSPSVVREGDARVRSGAARSASPTAPRRDKGSAGTAGTAGTAATAAGAATTAASGKKKAKKSSLSSVSSDAAGGARGDDAVSAAASLASAMLGGPPCAPTVVQQAVRRYKFKTHFRNTVYDVLRGLDYEETEGDDWDIYWCDVGWMRDHFDHTTWKGEHAKVCHFRSHYELTRKDIMYKNINRFRKQLEKEGREDPERFAFLPLTFWLPHDYRLFVEEFKRNPGLVWIVKPSGSAQGKGIFLINKISQLDAFKEDKRFDFSSEPSAASEDKDEKVVTYIVQRYIDRPYLIGGKKFDMRIYLMVQSYRPLKCWLYREGFARFSGAVFSMEDLSNTVVHLTNVAVQKTAKGYDKNKGCKWLMSQVKQYLITRHGKEAVYQMLRDLDNVFITSVQAVHPVVVQNNHSFEVYGFDILLDEDLKPKLLEINASPSITADTLTDYKLKIGMLEDAFAIADMEQK
jgi:tubulin polyglutamylase TTLL9